MIVFLFKCLLTCFLLKMENSNLKYKIGSTMIKGVGTQTIKKLVTALGSEEAIFQTPKKKLEKIPGIGDYLSQQIAEGPKILDDALREVEFAQKRGISILFYNDDEYPKRMVECNDHPIVLYKKGTANLNKGKFLGIVGTRKMTPYGKSVCEDIILELSQRHADVTIVSGLAYGVDICAHRKAIECGLATIGVVGHGLDQIYPYAHLATARRMMEEKGAIVTEYPSGTKIDRNNFVSRNRIIAGMCDAVLIIESGEKGGALLTAEFANSYHRDVFALPGRAGDLYSIGCNNLIKQNKASLVESAKDIEYLMNWDGNSQTNIQLSLFQELSDKEQSIVEFFRTEGAMQINILSRKSQMSISELTSLLFELEMKGVVASMPGNMYDLAHANGRR